MPPFSLDIFYLPSKLHQCCLEKLEATWGHGLLTGCAKTYIFIDKKYTYIGIKIIKDIVVRRGIELVTFALFTRRSKQLN